MSSIFVQYLDTPLNLRETWVTDDVLVSNIDRHDISCFCQMKASRVAQASKSIMRKGIKPLPLLDRPNQKHTDNMRQRSQTPSS